MTITILSTQFYKVNVSMHSAERSRMLHLIRENNSKICNEKFSTSEHKIYT